MAVHPNTERPVKVSEGSNKLIKTDAILSEVDLKPKVKDKSVNKFEFWDGKTEEKIVKNYIKGIE